MKTFMKNKGWRILCAGYVFIYLPWFFVLEKIFNADYPGLHIMNNSLDDAIPFLEVFIVPYVLWYFYVVGACILLYFTATNKEFLHFALSLMIGMSLALLTCMIYPNGLTLRPDSVSTSVFGKMITYLYGIDTSTNVFPSIHVYNSLAVAIALMKCNALKKQKVLITISNIICLSIVLATMFLKQHAIADVIGAFIYMAVLYYLIYKVDYTKLFKKNA